MVVANYHQGLYFSDELVDEPHLHFLKIVLNVLVHLFDVGDHLSDLEHHFGVVFRYLNSILEFPQKVHLQLCQKLRFILDVVMEGINGDGEVNVVQINLHAWV
jgi:hypothetical protein